jgi:twitching motility protein PilT
MDVNSLLMTGVNAGASDLHLTVGSLPIYRIDGKLNYAGKEKLTDDDLTGFAKTLLSPEKFEEFMISGDIDLAYSNAGHRHRVNLFKQMGSIAIVMRIINSKIPTMEELGLPNMFKEMVQKKKGLILVTGPTGSGKSTTLAAMIGFLNKNSSRHIITLEDPIEYIHSHNKSEINQREVGRDTEGFQIGLRAALRQDPDVILVGEMRDAETISTAVTAAETGHLVLSTLHTNGAANTVDRIIDVFEPHQQQQIRAQLANVIELIVSQQLLPKAGGKGRIAVFEIMTGTNAIRNLIRDDKIYQITSTMQTGTRFGMQTMEAALDKVTKTGQVTQVEAKRVLSLF